MKTGFTWDTQDKEYDTKKAVETWEAAKKFLSDDKIDLVVLDEITYMINYGYLDESEILAVLKNRPVNQYFNR